MINDNKVVVWDWNGTLLNDMDICITAMNELLGVRELPPLTVEKYRKVFTFPVKEYYKAVGFDFGAEPFEKPAIEFIDLYKAKLQGAALFPEVEQALSTVKEMGYLQAILSAMEQESLLKSVKQLNIGHYFDHIAGINNHYAHSKVGRGVELLKALKIKPKNAILLGDTLHDKEVADRLGVKCILIAQGHQHISRLKTADNVVVETLKEAVGLIPSVFGE